MTKIAAANEHYQLQSALNYQQYFWADKVCDMKKFMYKNIVWISPFSTQPFVLSRSRRQDAMADA